MDFPDELKPYRDVLEKTSQPYIAIRGTKRVTKPTQSKFAGNPYMPIGFEHPKDANGEYMRLLAQINFEEIPLLEHMPKQGILQFYISGNDDVMGLNFDDQTEQTNFRVVYHPVVLSDENQLVHDFSYTELNPDEDSSFPLENECALQFELKTEFVSTEDYRFDPLIRGDIDLDQKIGSVSLWDILADKFTNAGHKIGGYAYFTQSDPRGYVEKYKDYEILLLQIDTDDELGIMWGDVGVANFFITKNDLMKLNFSKVLYNWDCC